MIDLIKKGSLTAPLRPTSFPSFISLIPRIESGQAFPEKIARQAQELDCRSVAYTYNDPVIFMEYAMDVAQTCRQVGIKSVRLRSFA